MTRFRSKAMVAVAATSLVATQLVLAASPAAAAVAASVNGTARGQAAELRIDASPSGASAGDALVDVSRADSRINSVGFYANPTAPDDPTKNVGGLDAMGEAVPLRSSVVAPIGSTSSPGSAQTSSVAYASTAGAPGDTDDDGTVPGQPTVQVPQGCLTTPPCLATAETLGSHSEADQGGNTPNSSNSATTETATVGPAPSPFAISLATADSTSRRDGPDGAHSDANAQVASAGLSIVVGDPAVLSTETVVAIDLISATATAERSLLSGLASVNCSVGSISVTTITTVLGTTLPIPPAVITPIPECLNQTDIDLAPVPVVIKFGDAVTDLTAPGDRVEIVGNRSRASIAAVIVEAAGQIARFGIAEASAQAAPGVDKTCNSLTDPAPSAHGFGDAVLLDPGLIPVVDPVLGQILHLDVAASSATADKNGVPASALLHQRNVLDPSALQDRTADASGFVARVQTHPEPPIDRTVDPEAPPLALVAPPVVPPEPAIGAPPESGNPSTDTQLAASVAGSPPDTNQSTSVASLATPAPTQLGLTLVESMAGVGSLPGIHGDSSVDIANAQLTQNVGIPGVPPLALDVNTVSSNAHADTNGPADGFGSADVVGGLVFNAEIAGVPVNLTASAIDSSATASAAPGTSSSDLSWNIVDLQGSIGATPVGPFTVTGGKSDPAPGPIVVAVGPVTITLEFAVRTFSAPNAPHAFANVDAVRLTTSNGDLLALGRSQARAFQPAEITATMEKDVDIHYTPTGGPSYGDDKANVVPHQKLWYRLCVRNSLYSEGNVDGTIVDELDPQLKGKQAPPGFAFTGQTLSGPVSLPPGGEEAFEFLVEVRPATPTAGQAIPNQATLSGFAPATSNVVDVFVNVDPDQPALEAVKISSSMIGPNTVRVIARLQNRAGAGTANQAAIERIDCNAGVTAGNFVQPTNPAIPSGGSDTFQFDVTRANSSIKKFVCDIRETAVDDAGNPYAFD